MFKILTRILVILACTLNLACGGDGERKPARTQKPNILLIVLDDFGYNDLGANGGTNKNTENNSPFVGRKTDLLEGGVRTPLMIRWPGRILPDTQTDQPVSIYDIFPTLAGTAQAEIPAGLIGRNLLADDLPPAPTLFWEYSNSAVHNYAVLSGDGRWRLVHGYNGKVILNDLEADFSGAGNVSDKHPEVVATLREQYLRWRLGARVVTFNYQRAPGRIARHQAEGPPLEENSCSEVVVTGQWGFSMLRQNSSRVTTSLYVNGDLIDTVIATDVRPMFQGYENATYLGRDSLGEQAFRGVLGKPLILNERVVPDRVVPDTVVRKIHNDISNLPALCE